jgi:hypothetical protein
MPASNPQAITNVPAVFWQAETIGSAQPVTSCCTCCARAEAQSFAALALTLRRDNLASPAL